MKITFTILGAFIVSFSMNVFAEEFKIGRDNSDEAIQNLRELNGFSIEEIERRGLCRCTE